MQNSSFLNIYKASAGSGKTHTLTREYLTMAFSGANYFQNILAVTFTNKAAGEMKDRVLSDLFTLSKFPEKSSHLSHLQSTLSGISITDIQRKAKEILSNILHNYSFFSISTIDSFVQNIIRSFTFEIGVNSAYEIEMDLNKVKGDLIKLLFEKMDDFPGLKQWLIKFALDLIEENGKWNYYNEVFQLTSEIFKEKVQGILNSPFFYKALTEQRVSIQDLLQIVSSRIEEFRNGIRQISKEYQTIVTSKLGNVEGFGQNFTRIHNYFVYKIVNMDFSPMSTVDKAQNNIENWYNKNTSNEAKLLINQNESQLMNILNECQNFISNHKTEYNTCRLIRSHIHSFGILSDLNNVLTQYRVENNILMISDASLLLRNIIQNNETPFIYEKVGNRYNHILIDEFQDTSGFQWQNFLPLVRNSISEGHNSLLVGDVKQSIYRWRGGDWNLLLKNVYDDIGSHFIHDFNLETNWRSGKNIIAFNNSIFSILPRMIQDYINSKLESIPEKLSDELKSKGFDSMIPRAYQDWIQKASPKKDKFEGSVEILFFPVSNKSEIKEIALEKLPSKVYELIHTLGYKPSDIGILTRTNDQARSVFEVFIDFINILPENEQFEISSSESLLLYSNACVRCIYHALKFLGNHDDQTSMWSMTKEYLGISGDPPEPLFNDIIPEPGMLLGFDDLARFLPPDFKERTKTILKLSLYETVEELIKIFGIDAMNSESDYVNVFLDNVLNFTSKYGADIHGFCVWFENRKNSLSVPVPENNNAISLTTIHRSKGLAYRIVIIPFCDWELCSTTGHQNILWCETPGFLESEISHLPVNSGNLLIDSHFAKEYMEEIIYSAMDTMNLLYVAFTRPIDKLIVYCPEYSKEKENNLAFYMLQAIENFKKFNTDASLLSIDQYWVQKDDHKLLFIDTENPIFHPLKPESSKLSSMIISNNHWRDKLFIMNRSDDFFIKSVESIEEKVNFGILMHEILSKIETESDIDWVLQSLNFEGKITVAEMLNLKIRLKKIFKNEHIKKWFSDGIRCEIEHALLNLDGKLKIPDRIVYFEEKIHVIDFKFGEEKLEHIDQIKEYRYLLSQMETLKVDGYLYYAEYDKVIDIQSV